MSKNDTTSKDFEAQLNQLFADMASRLPPAQAIAVLEGAGIRIDQQKNVLSLALMKPEEQQQALQATNLTVRGTVRKYRPYGAIEYARLSVQVPKDLKDEWVASLESQGISQGGRVTKLIQGDLERKL